MAHHHHEHPNLHLPVDGALFYLKHVHGNKFVHPHGGSETPANQTDLVFHEPQGRLALQFLFETDSHGHRQLRHYSSGKYVHPHGGHAGNQTALCLYDGSDGGRTSINVAVHDGRTFLVHGDNKHYVHPHGGSDHPANETKLVFYDNHRESLAFEFVPVFPLPVDGVAYYLHHYEGNKFVHPHGGSDHPANQTELVFHEAKGRGTLEFVFETAHGHRQLRHNLSKKYVHPHGGHVGNQVPLCLHDGSDHARTSIDVVTHDGRTFLVHGDKKHYVHPHGGADHPANETKLVFYDNHRRSLAIQLVPVDHHLPQHLHQHHGHHHH